MRIQVNLCVGAHSCKHFTRMSYKKRLEYIESKWKAYPAIDVKVISVDELNKEFSSLTAGGKAKFDVFYLGGKIGQLVKSALSDVVEQFSFVCSGEEFFLKTTQLSDEQKKMVNEVLVTGDQVLIKCNWLNVFTSGLFPKIETIAPLEIMLLAPRRVDPIESKVAYKTVYKWEFFVSQIRKCFQFLGFTEVKTPTLVTSPGLEPFLDPFKVEFEFGKYKKSFYLPTSPEFSLKKYLGMGYDRIFEMKESFRNGELSEHHQPEFTMLEWYRAYSNLDSIIKDVKGLLNYLKLHWPEPIKAWGMVREVTISELFNEYYGFKLSPDTTLDELIMLANKNNIEIGSLDSWDDVFFRLFLEKIERNLGHNAPVVVRDYPPSQCAWARINNRGWADRFELYWRGIELANAFHELNDPIEQRKRFEDANKKRVELGKLALPIDEDLMKSLEAGFPPSGGIALGLDRLFMLMVDVENINQIRHFTVGDSKNN